MNATGDGDDDVLAFESLLRWYVAMGVDAPLDEAPHDRFVALTAPSAEPRLPAGRSPESRPTPAEPAAVRRGPAAPTDLGADDLVRHAQAAAEGAGDLAELRDAWAAVPGCSLAATAANMIFSGGNPAAALMLVGGAPDAEDERTGEAFSGSGGRLLDAMLRAIGLDRAGVYLANVVPWRPPGKRAPTPLELALCLPFARRHIELAKPALIVCLGERAAQPLLGTRDPISRLRGRWLSYEGAAGTVKTLVTFSPDYLIGQPLQKRRAWADLLMVATELGR